MAAMASAAPPMITPLLGPPDLERGGALRGAARRLGAAGLGAAVAAGAVTLSLHAPQVKVAPGATWSSPYWAPHCGQANELMGVLKLWDGRS